MDMNDPASRTRLQREVLELYRHYKINPLSAFVLPFLQLPIFVSFFFGCRDVSVTVLQRRDLAWGTAAHNLNNVSCVAEQMGQNFPDLATGGAMWFTDLSAADPTYIFPVVTSLTFLVCEDFLAHGCCCGRFSWTEQLCLFCSRVQLMLEIGADGIPAQQKTMFKNVMRGLGVLMVPMTASMPAVTHPSPVWPL